MTRSVIATLLVALVAALPSSLQAQPSASRRPPATGSPRIAVCSLLPKSEVKKHLSWRAMLDRMEPEEEPIGVAGSSCNYPSVFVQVLPFSRGMIDAARKKGGLETVRGVGDEAYFYDNVNGYAEIYVKSGRHLLTVQANVDGNMATVKPAALNLAKALVAKLP